MLGPLFKYYHWRFVDVLARFWSMNAATLSRSFLPNRSCPLGACSHCLQNLRNSFVHMAQGLTILRFNMPDETTSLPEGITRLTEGLWLQAEVQLGCWTRHMTTISRSATKNAPHVDSIVRRTPDEAQESSWELEVIDFPVFCATHALIVAKPETQNRAQHGEPILHFLSKTTVYDFAACISSVSGSM